jgi:hypothetical protein
LAKLLSSAPLGKAELDLRNVAFFEKAEPALNFLSNLSIFFILLILYITQINISKEYIIYNFSGLNYIINNFVSNIIKFIHPETIFYNVNIEKYFNEIIRDIKASIDNFKYNSPYILCTKYLSYLLDNNLLPHEKLDFLNKLTFNSFKIQLEKCLKYSYEYYFLIGINKYGYNYGFEILSHDKYDFINDNYLNNIIDMISINHKKYLDINIKNNNIIT